MHELSLAQSIMEIIETRAVVDGFRKVKEVRLEIGKLSCVEPESLEFCFDSVTRGTIAEDAILIIDRIPGKAWCWDCGRTVEIDTRGDPCPACLGIKIKIQSGDALRIKELEVL